MVTRELSSSLTDFRDLFFWLEKLFLHQTIFLTSQAPKSHSSMQIPVQFRSHLVTENFDLCGMMIKQIRPDSCKSRKEGKAQNIIEKKYALKHPFHHHHHPSTFLPFLAECLKRYEVSYVNMLHVLINSDVRLYRLIVNSCSKNTNTSSIENSNE